MKKNNKTHSLSGFPERSKINAIKRKSFLTNDYRYLILLLGGIFLSGWGYAQTTSYGNNAGTGGTNNSFFGYYAGGMTTGNTNTFIGYIAAGYQNTGNDNVMIGFFSGLKNNAGSSGSENTFIGRESGKENTGSGNVFIGNGTGKNDSNLSNALIIDNTSTSTPLIFGDFSANKVGINTRSFPSSLGGKDISSYSLFVEGGILTKGLHVRTNWADYVFDEKYALLPLEELEAYIGKHKHLPNVPSEVQVSTEGLEIGEIRKIQQEKIEELTLYILQLNKKLKDRQKKLETRKKKLEAQQREIDQLKKTAGHG